MTGFFYFFPDSSGEILHEGLINQKVLQSCGLSRVFDECMEVPTLCTKHKTEGPGGVIGTVLYPKPAHGDLPERLTYNASSQTWIGRGKFSIGVDKNQLPAPEDLLRTQQFPGFKLKDRHGNNWSLPILRMPDGRGSLPVEYSFDVEGNVTHEICREFKDVWALSGKALDYLQATLVDTVEDLNKEWPEQTLVKMAVEFLGINYRISFHEMAAMSEIGTAVFDTEYVMTVMVCVTNWPVWVEHLERKSEEEKKKPLCQVAA